MQISLLASATPVIPRCSVGAMGVAFKKPAVEATWVAQRPYNIWGGGVDLHERVRPKTTDPVLGHRGTCVGHFLRLDAVGRRCELTTIPVGSSTLSQRFTRQTPPHLRQTPRCPCTAMDQM